MRAFVIRRTYCGFDTHKICKYPASDDVVIGRVCKCSGWGKVGEIRGPYYRLHLWPLNNLHCIDFVFPSLCSLHFLSRFSEDVSC